MIISVHIPKTAGTSFLASLQQRFGARVLHRDEINHWPGWRSHYDPEALALQDERMTKGLKHKRKILRIADVIHGHFVASQYANSFAGSPLVAFFRDPYQHAMSYFYFLLRRGPESDHPAARVFHDQKMSIIDFIRWDGLANPQSYLLGETTIEDLAMVGLTEQFEKSIKSFNITFGTALSSNIYYNATPDKETPRWKIPLAIKREIKVYRAADIDLYKRAKEVFFRQIAAAEEPRSYLFNGTR